MRKLFLIALLAAASTGATAQRSGSHFSTSTFSRTFNHSRNSHGTPHSLYDPLGIFSDPFYSGALPGQPSAFSTQPPSSGGMPEQFAPPAQPLLIELQGNSYVRLSGPDDIHSGTSRTEPARKDSRTSSLESLDDSARTKTSRNLAPVTLIFRDGHRDQVSDYTIADGVLYTRGDYYASGSWSKKIELSSLDLPETIKLNQAQEVHFRLPAAPNEVITRP
jgi:hypothetical protein